MSGRRLACYPSVCLSCPSWLPRGLVQLSAGFRLKSGKSWLEVSQHSVSNSAIPSLYLHLGSRLKCLKSLNPQIPRERRWLSWTARPKQSTRLIDLLVCVARVRCVRMSDLRFSDISGVCCHISHICHDVRIEKNMTSTNHHDHHAPPGASCRARASTASGSDSITAVLFHLFCIFYIFMLLYFLIFLLSLISCLRSFEILPPSDLSHLSLISTFWATE